MRRVVRTRSAHPHFAVRAMSSTSKPIPDRRIDLDWVRILAFGVLILYHVGMYYVTWDWHVKSPYASTTLEPLMMLSSPWRLSLLFFVSGCATAFLHAKSARGFVRSRTQRLLIPLALGLWVIVPPQSWAQVTEAVGYHGGYLHFMRLYADGYSGFCREDCLRIPTWNHLWFVAYLWCYTMVAALTWWAIGRARVARWGAACARCLRGPGLFVLPVAWLAAIRIALVARFPDTHALVDDWFEHATYFSVFVLGLLLARETGVWEEMCRQRWRALALALASYGVVATYFSHYASVAPPDWLRQGQRVFYALDQWAAIVAALGFARHWNPADSRARRYLTEAIFPFYIVHQTAIVVLAHCMKPLGLRPPVEGPLLIAATVAICFASFEIVRRVGWLRPLFGLAPAARRGGRAVRAPGTGPGLTAACRQ
jgi:glucan biosynthesis protein C